MWNFSSLVSLVLFKKPLRYRVYQKTQLKRLYSTFYANPFLLLVEGKDGKELEMV
jgi:hypothetical protein